MQNKLDEFTAALAAKLKAGNVTPDEIKRLADQYTEKPKRGCPKKDKPTPKDKRNRGRPYCDNSMAMKYRVMGLWVMLSRVDILKW